MAGAGQREFGWLAADRAESHYESGILHQGRGELEQAAERFAAAASLAPADPRFAFSLAAVRRLQGRAAEAARLYEKTLAIDPGCAQAHYNLGVIAMEDGRFESAAAHFTEAIAREPGLPQAHNNLGAAWMALGRVQQAAASFNAAIRLDAGCVAAHHNFGRLCFAGREWDKAIAHFQHALELGADPQSALLHIGLCHHANGNLDAAEGCYMQLLEADPNDVEAHLNLARLSLDREDPARARHWCLKAASMQPERADAVLRSGQILEQCGYFEEALASRDRALRLRPEDPGIRFDRALLLLRMGRFAEAWPDYEWRFKRPNWPQAYPHRISAPRWDGAPFGGKTLLVHCEQGLGDTLQFARYLPLVKARGGRVLFEVPGPLVKLFQRLPGADELLELSAAAITRRPFDLHIPLLSLPGLFGTTVDTVPANLPFIAPEPAKVSGWRQRLGSNTVNIGIVWAGSAWHHNDGQRSCPLSLFLPLARMPVIRLVALQKGEAAKAVDRLLEGVPFVNAGPELQDFSDTADLVAALDLVITVDTAAAHLAATMETPTWVVVPFPADWRWMLGREDSPWYPTLRLFRQTRRGCWQEVFTAVERALREFIAKRRARPAETLLRPGAPDSRDSSHAERPGNMTKSAPHPTDPSSPERAPAATIPSDPNVPFAWLDAAEACEARNRIPEAIDCYRRALALDPTLADGHYHLGNLYLDQKRFSEAVACFDQALKARPEFPEAFFNHGVALLGLNRLPEADACFREAVRLKPDMTAAHYNLGFSLQKQSRWREAVASLQRAVAIDNRFAQAWNNMGTCFQELGRRVDAMSNCRQAAACYQKALECDTQDAAVFCNNLGKLHQDLHDIPAAISWYRRAIARRPEYAEAYFNLATAQLLAGSFAEGWTNYEWRLRRGDWQRFYPRRFTLPRWDGFPFKGRTLWVHTEQGLGDTLQFVRYLPQVKALGGKVVFETRRTFFDLFYKLPGVDRLVEMGPASDPESEADLYVPLASLPGIFKSDLGSIPADVPYLAAPADRLQRWGKRLAGSELRVGLVWAGSVVDPNRSLPLAWFAPLTRIPGTRWYGLQKGAAADQALAEGLPPGMDLSLIGVEFEDFGDTAAAAACLDLILSIDTSVAHLSGALAKPTYLLLDYCSDWRWLLEREESPWYPTMRLFRQQRPGDWSAPLTRVGRELETLSANLAKALTVEGAAGLVAGIDFYRRQGRAVEALVFAERLRRRSA